MSLTREEADRLVALPKTIEQVIHWLPVGPSTSRFRFRSVVNCPPPNPDLELIGNVGVTNWSFVLLHPSMAPLRKLTVHGGGHVNPDGSDAGPHHKHIWDAEHQDRITYTPGDVRFHDFNLALEDFLRECSITLRAEYAPLTIPRRLA